MADGRDPDFVIIGAQRGGTTSLYRYLVAHPNFAPAAKKELHFFDNRFDLGIAWYTAQFPRPTPERPVTGEATPYYLFHPHAPRRLAALMPAAKLIVLLRNPVDRAYSHYQHEVRRGNETLTFEEAIAAQDERLRGEQERMLADETYRSRAHQRFSYLARGRYLDQLRVWFDRFPRDRFLILKSEDFYRNPVATVRHATDFLGLPRAPLVDRRAYNDEPYAPMRPETRRRLEEHFREPNRELAAALGDHFTWPEAAPLA